MSKIVPNTYQKPNLYADQLMYLLNGDEYKTLDYAVRRIMGFQKQTDRISLSQFMNGNGVVGENGELVEHGTGLGRQQQLNALNALVAFGILVEVAPNDPKTNEGREWRLQLDDRRIRLDLLKQRHEEEKNKHRKRTAKAREAALKAAESVAEPEPSDDGEDGERGLWDRPEGGLSDRPGEGSVGQTEGWSVGQTGGSLSDRPGGGLWDRHTDNQLENQLSESQGRKPEAGASRQTHTVINGHDNDESIELVRGMLWSFAGRNDELAIAIWLLQKHVIEATFLQRPDIDTDSGRRTLERDWWPHLRTMLAQANSLDLAKEIVTEAVHRLDQSKKKLTIAGPKSLLTTFSSVLAERRRQQVRQQETGGKKKRRDLRDLLKEIDEKGATS